MKTKLVVNKIIAPAIRNQIATMVGIYELLDLGSISVQEIADKCNVENPEELFDKILNIITNEILPLVKGNKRFPNGLLTSRKTLIINLDLKVLISTDDSATETIILSVSDSDKPKKSKRNKKSKSN